MKLSDLQPRPVYNLAPRLSDEEKRERNRKLVYAWRARNRERWNEIQRDYRKRKAMT